MNSLGFGTAVGVALGFALAFGGFGPMFIVLLFAALGFAVAKISTGDLHVGSYLKSRRHTP